MRRFLLLSLWACGLLVLPACGSEPSTAVEEVRELVDPPPALYRFLWTVTRDCSGLTRDFEGVRWYWTPHFPDQPNTVAQWNSRREITIAFEYRNDRFVVMHEILHDMLDGDGEHLSPLWDACEIPKGNTGT